MEDDTLDFLPLSALLPKITNVAPGRGRKPGYKHLDETKQKIGSSLAGKTFSLEQRAAMKEVWARRKAEGFTVSDETRSKMSLAKKGKPLSDDHKAAIKAARSSKDLNSDLVSTED